MEELKDAIVTDLKCSKYQPKLLIEFWFHSQEFGKLNECISELIKADIDKMDITQMTDEEMSCFVNHESLGLNSDHLHCTG